MSKSQLTKEAIYQEFELATHDMDFTENEEMRKMFLIYFSAGALWAQGELLTEEVWIPGSFEDIKKFMN